MCVFEQYRYEGNLLRKSNVYITDFLESWEIYILLKIDVYNLQLDEIVHQRATCFEAMDLKWANPEFYAQNPGVMTRGIEIWQICGHFSAAALPCCCLKI